MDAPSEMLVIFDGAQGVQLCWAAGVMQEGKAVVPLLPYARWNLAIMIQAKLEKKVSQRRAATHDF